VLLRVGQPIEEPLLLLVPGDVQHALEDGQPAGGQARLPLVDPVVTRRPLLHGGEAAHALHQHRLVVRTVEHPNPAGARELALVAPQEPVGLLLVGGWPEADHAEAERVEQAVHRLGGATLAGGVHALEDDEE
jgi:hypothetical protein